MPDHGVDDMANAELTAVGRRNLRVLIELADYHFSGTGETATEITPAGFIGTLFLKTVQKQFVADNLAH